MSLETINLREEIKELSACIANAENYISHLKERYTNPSNTVTKYQNKISAWKKERYELEKELLVLTNQPCNS